MEQELLFLFEKCPGALPLYHALEERLREAVPGMAVKVGKSQASFLPAPPIRLCLSAGRQAEEGPAGPLSDRDLWPGLSGGEPPHCRKDRALPQPLDPPCGPWPRGGDRRRAAGVAAGGVGVCRLENDKQGYFPSWHGKRHPQWDAFFCI